MPKKVFLVTLPDGHDQRLDVFLSGKISELSRSQVQNLISAHKVTVNHSMTKASFRLKEGDEVEVDYRVPIPRKIMPEDIPLDILYQDNHILVLNKSSGIVVHPGAGNPIHTLVNALLFHFPRIHAIGPSERPGIVHRLDKETSGLMVVALTELAYTELQHQFKVREVDKLYQGLVWGKFSAHEGIISWPIGRHVRHRERVSVKTHKPHKAETRYRVRQDFDRFTLLEIKPVTGRMHQIRVHLAASGHPVVGDSVYGRRKSQPMCPRLFLHAERLAFSHPHTKERLEFFSSLPQDLQDFLDKIERLV